MPYKLRPAECPICRTEYMARATSRFCSKACSRRLTPEKFWQKVDRRGPDECWPWLGSTDACGYGRMKADGIRLAHRYAYRDARGALPDGAEICHRCDNPSCVNPAHLFVGTHRDNMVDAAEKGRMHRLKRGRAPITPEIVERIRAMYPGMSQQAIADAFGLSQTHVSRIVRREARRNHPSS
jgi:predicted XRE-type DNA-binding protein